MSSTSSHYDERHALEHGGIVRLQDILPPTRWATKKDRPTCYDCNSKFSNFFRRRHHCRLCGELFCKQCIVQKCLHVPGHEKSYVKICRSCALEEATALSTSSNRSADPTEHLPSNLKLLAKDLMAKTTPNLLCDLRISTSSSGSLVPRTGEKDRLSVLRDYNICYTTPDDVLDGLCSMAAAMLHCPMAIIGFMEENQEWVKSSVGLDVTALPRKDSMCGEVVSSQNSLIVFDTLNDARFKNSALVTDFSVRFYAAVPLMNSNGWILGTLAVMDYEPRKDCDIKHLFELADAAVNNLRRSKPKARRRTLSCDDAPTSQPRSHVRLLDSDFNMKTVEAESTPICTPTNSSLTDSNRSGMSASTPTNGGHQSFTDSNRSESTYQAKLMELLSQSTKTQEALAQHHGALASTVGEHSQKIDKLTEAISRMESKFHTAN